MGNVNKSAVQRTTIPKGDEHHRCREAFSNEGAGVNIRHQHGRTPLIYAVKEDHVQCVKKLIKAGADVNEADSKGFTALMFAVKEYHVQSVITLIKAGADVNVRNNDGLNALHITDDNFYIGNPSRRIKRFLRAGIHFNKFSMSRASNALGIMINDGVIDKAAMMLLYAAGETLDGTDVDKIPEELKFEDEKLKLKHICREAIRKHMLSLDFYSNLFGRIPKLELPSALNKYLLFNQSLDDDDEKEEDVIC